ncbi:hypothetical protein [Sutcliffiella rhizosphaerae]|uniref:Uncharacterized protein n=1 Tax=Sutcliffiella rhizosphaerae TaxID=2880967 RepID=A0ABN8ADY0_9BACI|nr:hypothetical protein [Sutcliffiella rhizosphaerae]CAG9621942.1 hypothetical protein BACCIP111883_02733 [Sutcliffiella rhizosphaerae]
MNKAIGIIICISFTFLIFHTSSLVKTVFTHQYPPIPAGKLPIITIVDIMDDSLRNITVEDNGSYFKESSSLIVPIQYELRQEFFLDADRESSMLFSKKYQLISEFLTKSFTQQLLKYHEGNGQYQKINDDFFHDLYVSESQLYDTYSVIARKDKQVYVVIFNGEVTIDALIEAVKQNTE